MMRKILGLCWMVVLFSGAGLVTASEPVTRLGEPLTQGLETTRIEALVADPDAWVGKRVRIAGEVEGVCAMEGCWMDLVSPGDVTLRVKVDDGVIVFPAGSVGQQAIAEGTVEIVEMTREGYASFMKHAADEEAAEFDPGSIGDGPYRIVRLRGHGAEVSAP